MFEATEIHRGDRRGPRMRLPADRGDDGTRFTGIVVSPAFEGKRRARSSTRCHATLGKLMGNKRSTPPALHPCPPSGLNSSRNWAARRPRSMDKLLIEGGVPLSGEIAISGAKNAALPILCAAAHHRALHLHQRAASQRRIGTLLRLLEQMGVKVAVDGDAGRWTPAGWTTRASYEMVKTMRASISGARPAGGPLRRGPGACPAAARSAPPGGPAHQGLQAMGAAVKRRARLRARQVPRLKGARIFTDMVTVTGTET